MARQHQHKTYSRLLLILRELRPRPNTGFLYKDILFLLIISFLQNTILPTFLVLDFTIDLITPWLVITAVRQRFPQVTLLTFVATLTIEMRNTVPAGMYIVTYWIAINIIMQVRAALSWRHKVPWLVTNLITAIWVHLFEAFVLLLARGTEPLSWLFWSHQTFKIFTATVFGAILCREWLRIDAEEPVPK